MIEQQRLGDRGRPEPSFYVGRRVRVHDGPMGGHSGVVRSARKACGDNFPDLTVELDCDPGARWAHSARMVELLEE